MQDLKNDNRSGSNTEFGTASEFPRTSFEDRICRRIQVDWILPYWQRRACSYKFRAVSSSVLSIAIAQRCLNKLRHSLRLTPYGVVVLFPNDDWAPGTPESQELDSAKLRIAIAFLERHCGHDGLSEVLLIRNGVCVFRGSNTERVHSVRSCAKSFTSTVLGLLIDDNKCQIDTVAASVEPRLRDQYPAVTLRHFATMTSGYSPSRDEESSKLSRPTKYARAFFPGPPVAAPGKAFAYSDEAMAMFARVLTRLAEQNLNDYLYDKVYVPIRIDHVSWGTLGDVNGVSVVNGATDISLCAGQLARLGHLYLNRGVWEGRQVIPAAWVDAATCVQVPITIPVANTARSNVRGSGSYGYNWWVNGGLSSLPQAPLRTFYASGFNHNVCVVVPEWNLVVVRMGSDGNPAIGKHNLYSRFLGLLSEGLN